MSEKREPEETEEQAGKKQKTAGPEESLEVPTETVLPPPPGPPPSVAFEGTKDLEQYSAGQNLFEGKKDLEHLPVSVQALFQNLFVGGTCSKEDLDISIFDSLLDFDESTQVEIVNSFSSASLATIRNKTGYFIGILKQYRKRGQGLSRGGAPAQQAATAAPTVSGQAAAYAQWASATGQAAAQAAYGSTFAQYLAAGHDQTSAANAANAAAQAAWEPYAQAASQAQVASAGAVATGAEGGDKLSQLSFSAQQRLQQVFSTGICTFAELDSSIYDSLADFDEANQCAIVDRFALANLSTVRNKTGYFISILKQARAARKGGQGGLVPSTPAAPQYGYGIDPATGQYTYGIVQAYPGQTQAGYPSTQPQALGGEPRSLEKVPAQVQNKFRELYAAGMVSVTDLEDCVFDSLADFSEQEQIEMVDSFANANLSAIRNKTAFFIGILKRHRQTRHQ